MSFASGFVALVGRPNVGKSTLTNLLVGEKVAIVSSVPQTTRSRVRGIIHRDSGQIVLVDTPGIHKPKHEMNRWMVAAATGAMHEVDLIVMMIEAPKGPSRRSPLGPGDRFILSQLPDDGRPVVLLINKIDRVPKKHLLPMIDQVRAEFPFKEILLTSALKEDNTEDVVERLMAYLPEGPELFPRGQSTDQEQRNLFAEIIREKLLHHTRQELPHETCVIVDRIEKNEKSIVVIEATILVERDSQRKIVIGREASLLKTVGTEARTEIEMLLSKKVFLDLWVKVRQRWRDDRATLIRLGMHPEA